MKPPYHIGAACIAMALAACSGAQTSSTSSTIPALGAPQTTSVTSAMTPDVNNGHQIAGAHKATAALIIVANENIGLGGSVLEYAESANGNVAPSTAITHINGPTAVAFSSKEGIGIANGNVESGGQAALQTFGLAGDLLTGISCFPRSHTSAVAFDTTGQLFASTFSAAGRAVEVFAPGANGCVNPKRTISDEGGLAIDSNNVLYVANNGFGSSSETATIDIFAAGSSTMEAQIGGSNTGLEASGSTLPTDTVAVDASHNVYIFDVKTATISEFAAGATGNVAPIRTIAGSKTGLNGGNGFSFGLAVSKTSGEIFVSNPGSNAILGFAATASGNVAPIQAIAGSATGLGDPLDLAVTE
jgi:hypothetical protein